MSLHLWIMRHGEAEPLRTTDGERALTPLGQADARSVGAWLARQPQPPARVLASPLRRAQETAAAVMRSLPGLTLETVPWLVPDHRPLAAVDALQQCRGAVLLVSHQPLVGDLVGLLVHGDAGHAEPLTTAALAELELPVAAPGLATLCSLQSPASLARGGTP